MKGTVYVYQPGSRLSDGEELTAPPDLEFIKAKLDGGWIEQVPGFNNIQIGDKLHRCVAFCDEEGKLKKLPINRFATIAWSDAVPTGLKNLDGSFADVLVGPVVVIIGDDEFMESL